MKYDIVPYSDDLKSGIFDFTDECFRELGKVFEPSGRHYFYNDIDHSFESFHCLIINGNVAGTAALKRLDDNTAELKALYLDKDLRGQGLGFRLLDTEVSEARNKGFKRIVLDSMSQYSDALRLYDRYGFKRTDRFNDNPYADFFMELSL